MVDHEIVLWKISIYYQESRNLDLVQKVQNTCVMLRVYASHVYARSLCEGAFNGRRIQFRITIPYQKIAN